MILPKGVDLGKKECWKRSRNRFIGVSPPLRCRIIEEMHSSFPDVSKTHEYFSS
jgi:hypothetical protein